MIKDLEKAFEGFKNKKGIVFGDIMLDCFKIGVIDRLNPERHSSPLIKIIRENCILGGAANVANNLASLNVETILYGLIGNDKAGKIIKNLCEKKDINLRPYLYERPTITKNRIIEEERGDYIVRFDEGELDIENFILKEKLEKEILIDFERNLDPFDFVFLSDYDKSFFRGGIAQKIIGLAKAKGIMVVAAPKPANLDKMVGCDTICLNREEAEKISRIKYSSKEDALVEMSKKIAKTAQVKYVVITCGDHGAFSYYNKKGEKIGTQTKEVVDVTGAGDTFAAVLTLGMSSGLNIFDSAKLANYTAGIVVEKVGTATTSVDDIKKRLRRD